MQSEEDKMEIDQVEETKAKINLENVEELIKKSSGVRKPLFGKLDSKLCVGMVLGYAFTWDRVIKFFKLISKKG